MGFKTTHLFYAEEANNRKGLFVFDQKNGRLGKPSYDKDTGEHSIRYLDGTVAHLKKCNLLQFEAFELHTVLTQKQIALRNKIDLFEQLMPRDMIALKGGQIPDSWWKPIPDKRLHKRKEGETDEIVLSPEIEEDVVV